MIEAMTVIIRVCVVNHWPARSCADMNHFSKRRKVGSGAVFITGLFLLLYPLLGGVGFLMKRLFHARLYYRWNVEGRKKFRRCGTHGGFLSKAFGFLMILNSITRLVRDFLRLCCDFCGVLSC